MRYVTYLLYALQIQFLPEGTNFGSYISRAQNFETNPLRVYLIWGMELQDLSDCHKTDFNCNGQTVYDSAFSMERDVSQVAMLV